MASNKLKYSDIAEKGLLEPMIKELEKINKLLEITSDNLKGVIALETKAAKESGFDNYADIEKKAKAIETVKSATQELDKVEKERVKLQERLNGLNDERQKDLFAIREEIKAQTKALRDDAKAAAESNNAYKKLTSQTNKAQAEFKRLAAEFGVNSKEAKEARKEFDRLDRQLRDVNEAARDGRRDVGRYQKAWEGMNATLKVGIIGAILLALEKMGELFGNNTAGVDKLEKGLNRLLVPLQVFVNVLVNLSNQAGDIFNNISTQVQILGNQFQIAGLQAINFGGVMNEKIAELAKNNIELSKSFKQLQNPFAGFFDEVEERLESLDKAIDLTTKYSTANARLRKEIAQLRGEQAIAQAQADDTTQSFEKQLDGLDKLIAKNEEINKKELQIIDNEIQIAQLRRRGNEENVELLNAVIELEAERLATVAEQNAEELQLNKQRVEILRDRFEQELDILFDVSDRRKSINERIAADETKSFQDRQKAIQKARIDIAKSYQGIEDAFNKFVGGNPIDLKELLSIEDTQEFQARVDQLRTEFNIDEITINRLREARIELDAATQDLIEADRDLFKAEQDLNDLNTDIILQEEALLKIYQDRRQVEAILNELSEKRLQNEIQNLRDRILVAEEGSTELAQLEQELNNKLLELAQSKAEKQNEIEKKAAKERIELQESIFVILRALNDKYNRERLEAIDKEISATEKREQRLFELAQAGEETAEENLARTQKRQAELERERERQLQRQKRSELALTAIETYTSKVNADDPNPLASTISDITLLQQFVQSLPAFFEGAENIGAELGKPQLKGKDGYIVRVDGSERVLTGQQNAMIPRSMSNVELATLAHKASKGGLTESNRIEQKLDKVVEAIQQKPTYLGKDYDPITKSIIDKIEYKGKLIRNHSKNNRGIFG